MNLHERRFFNASGALHLLLLFVCVAMLATAASAQKSRPVPGDNAPKKVRVIEPVRARPEAAPTPTATASFPNQNISCADLADMRTFANVVSGNELKLNFSGGNFNFANASFFFKTYTSAQGSVIAVPENNPAFNTKTINVSVNETTNLGANNTHTISSFTSELPITAVILKIGNDSYAFNYNPATTTGGPLTVTQRQGISHINFCFSSGLGPSAAGISASGRVMNANGRGLGGINVFITDTSTGETRYTMTSPFGYYMFDDLEAGRFYFITVSSKNYSFGGGLRSFTLNDSLSDIDFVANP